MKTRLITAALGALMLAPAALAEDHEIRMLNAGPDGDPMVFEPAYLEIEPGDTVTFVNAQGAHNAQTIDGMIPDGGEGFRGGMRQDVSFTPEAEGVWGIKCMPHYGAGMVALIKVGDGDAANLDDAASVRHPGRARSRFEDLFDMARADQADASADSR